MAILVGLPVLALSVILQSTVFSRVTLLSGSVDLVMIVIVSWALNDRVNDEWIWAVIAGAMIGFISALPIWLPILSLLLVTAIGLYLKQRVWQIPVLALFVNIFVGTLITQLLSLAVLSALQGGIAVGEAFNVVILPSLLLNLLAALPVNILISEVASWLYAEELEA